jgi:hypothetical protein
VTICRLHSRRRNRNPSRCGHDPQGGARPAVGNQRSMAADNAAAWPRDAEIPLTDVRSVPKTGLARPPPTQQTARKGRLNFLYAETSSAAGKLVFHVFAALAEFERNLIRERTHAGLAAARARGRKGGRKPALTPQQVREIKALLRDPSIPVASIAGRYGVSRATIYKHAGADAPARHQSGAGQSSGPATGANKA